MDRAGEKLKRIRERLKLTYRDVEQASQQLAALRGSTEFVIPISRLADIENSGKVPSVFRLYSLCAVYRLDLNEVMNWYGVPTQELTSDALRIGLDETHPVQIQFEAPGAAVEGTAVTGNLSQTTFLGQFGKQSPGLPFPFLNGIDLRKCRYGLVGLEDWSMFPILRPGSLVLIDESRRKIARGGWASEFDRPIYFLEHRSGFTCGWCALDTDRLFVHPHPASEKQPSLYRFPEEIEVIGQITGVAMRLAPEKRRPARSSSHPY